MSGSSNHEFLWVGGGVGLAIVAVILWSAREDARHDYEQSRPAAVSTVSPAGGWQTRAAPDPMGGPGGQITCTLSTNSLVLPWPYEEVRAELCFRRTERQGFDAMIQIQPKAVIVCHPDRCPITVRVDDGAMRTYAGVDAEAGSANLVFFDNPTRLQQALAGSRLARMEVTLLDYGSAVFTFSTADMPPI